MASDECYKSYHWISTYDLTIGVHVLLPFQGVYNAALQTDTVVIVSEASCEDGYGLAGNVCGETYTLLWLVHLMFSVSFTLLTLVVI